jgi:hypothetical protein
MASKLFFSAKGLTKTQLMAVMRYHLSSFNDEGVEISNNTIHNEVLSTGDGATASTSSKNMYKGLMRWTVDANGHEDKPWPNKWMELSVEELATAII